MKKRKFICIALSAFMACAALIGCDFKKGDNDNNGGAINPPPAPAEEYKYVDYTPATIPTPAWVRRRWVIPREPLGASGTA